MCRDRGKRVIADTNVATSTDAVDDARMAEFFAGLTPQQETVEMMNVVAPHPIIEATSPVTYQNFVQSSRAGLQWYRLRQSASERLAEHSPLHQPPDHAPEPPFDARAPQPRHDEKKNRVSKLRNTFNNMLDSPATTKHVVAMIAWITAFDAAVYNYVPPGTRDPRIIMSSMLIGFGGIILIKMI